MSPAGRPQIGEPINVRLGKELLAAVDRMADRQGMSRAEVIRMLLEDRLQGRDVQRLAVLQPPQEKQMRGVYYGGERPERVGGQPHPPAFGERNQPGRRGGYQPMSTDPVRAWFVGWEDQARTQAREEVALDTVVCGDRRYGLTEMVAHVRERFKGADDNDQLWIYFLYAYACRQLYDAYAKGGSPQVSSGRGCPCDCLECRIDRHDICRYMKKCIRRPWQKRPRPVLNEGKT